MDRQDSQSNCSEFEAKSALAHFKVDADSPNLPRFPSLLRVYELVSLFILPT